MNFETRDPHREAIETAEDLRGGLEALAASDLPFAYDAEQMLDELDRAQNEQANQ